MRFPTSFRFSRAAVLTGAVATLLVGAPPPASAQSAESVQSGGAAGAPPDADSLIEEARKRQAAFEQYRASRIPVERQEPRTRLGAQCDRLIGRICIWYGGEDERDFPPEPTETERARRGLIGVLLETDEHVDDAWVTGQLVHYLVEQEDYRLAEQVAETCGIPETWWCSALLGYSRHDRGETEAADAVFQEALAGMPDEERAQWTSLRWVLGDEDRQELERLDPAARDAARDLFWRLSDPLFLVPGNDRLTDHLARLVEVKNQEDAENPQGLFWDEDLAEVLVRYGRIVGWSRTHDPSMAPESRFRLEDTRRVLGHHHPNSRGYLFPGEFLESPADVPPESWITAPRAARTWYAPSYAPDFRALETQVGRFRRGSEMLVVGAYRPVLSGGHGTGTAVNPFERVDGPVETGLFLVPVDGGDAVRVAGQEAEGVLTLRTEPGRYVSSLEVFDLRGARAWRARQGVKQVPLRPGGIDVSDLMILREGAGLPESLDEAIPLVRPGIRVRRGERFTVVWEVYGLRVQEPVRVTLGFTQGRPGFLSRVGEFLGIVEPEQPVEVTFTEEAGDDVQAVFRSIEMELPDLEAGEYTLHLRLDLAGREPVIASRPIVVED